jgi:acetylglutamate kinase
VAGTTQGVLGSGGGTVEVLDSAGVAALIDDGTATAGMIAKLRACAQALAHGVDEVVIANGLDRSALVAAASGDAADGTTRIRASVAGGHVRAALG